MDSPHPRNAALLGQHADFNPVQPAARIEELLRSWGEIYNLGLDSSPDALSHIRLGEFRWEGGSYSDYRNFVRAYEVEL